PPTPSCVWLVTSPTISAALGNGHRHDRAGSPPPGSAAGFVTSARRPPNPPVHPNPHGQDPDAHQDRRTSRPSHDRRSANTPPRRLQTTNKTVKQQAKSLSGNRISISAQVGVAR